MALWTANKPSEQMRFRRTPKWVSGKCLLSLLGAALTFIPQSTKLTSTSPSAKQALDASRRSPSTGNFDQTRPAQHAREVSQAAREPIKKLSSYDDIAKASNDYPLEESFNFLKYPRDWIDAARKGDGRAARLVYEALSNCVIFSDSSESQKNAFAQTLGSQGEFSNDCRSIPSAYANDKAAFLEASAAKGDILSQYLYGVEKLSAARLQQRFGNDTNSSELNQRALSFLENAAHFGLDEAFAQVANAYETGALGKRDPTNAYAYLVALQTLQTASGPSSITERAFPKLRDGDKLVAQQQADYIVSRCCKQNGK